MDEEPVFLLEKPVYVEHAAVEEEKSRRNTNTGIALVPVDELQPEWPQEEDILADQLADVPLEKLFLGIEERAMEIVKAREQDSNDIDTKKRNAEIQARKEARFRLLLEAVEHGDIQEVTRLIDLGTDPNRKLNGVTPLIVAVTEGHQDIVELLISDDADVNLPGRYSMTPLHHAVYLNSYAVAKMLLQAEATPSPTTAYGITPLHIACREGNIRMIRLLLLFGADQFLTDQAGKMPHHYAQTEQVQTFIQEFAGRYMLQVMKQNKELQQMARDQQREISVLKQRLAMVSEMVEVQRKGVLKHADPKREKTLKELGAVARSSQVAKNVIPMPDGKKEEVTDEDELLNRPPSRKKSAPPSAL